VVVGIGIDLVSVARVERVVERHGDRFVRRVFTTGECEAVTGRFDRIYALAARFAAKEACFKALGGARGGGVTFQHIEVLGAAGHAPALRLTGRAAERAGTLGVRRTWVSLTHDAGVAAALVVLEG